MTTLLVDRLSATTPPGLQARTRGLLSGVAEQRLGDALRRSSLPDGDWHVRRLDVPLALDPARPDPSIEEAWAAAVLDALQSALGTGSADVVHYRHRVDALIDLVASLAGGDLERSWAWHQAGLVTSADPSRLGSPAAVALAALADAPEAVVAVLVRTLARVGLPRLHWLLGASGWIAAAEIAARAVHAPVALETLSVSSGSVVEGLLAPGARRTTARAALAERVSAALASSRLAAAFGSGIIRADDRVATAWAVLALAEADPAVLGRAEVAGVVGAAAESLGVRPGGERPQRSEHPERPDRSERSDDRDGSVRPDRRAEQPTTVDEPAGLASETGRADEPDSAPATWPTVWGGLLFLLATAAEAGVPDGLTDDAVLGERPLSWCLHSLATRLVPAAHDDPAVLVLAGLPVPFEQPAHDVRPLAPAEDARLDEVAAGWAAATAARLDRGAEDPFDVVREVALRRGEIAWEPGWVEVHLRLDDVDTDVRRAGLDLDPGWVPWLGMVVRFCHG